METKKWTADLDGVLGEVSKSGKSQFEWAQLKQVVAVKLQAVCAEYHSAVQDLPEPYDAVLERLLSLLDDFPNAPFTVQRLCELLLDPHRIYTTSTRKVCSALEKLLTVSSTVPTMAIATPKAGTQHIPRATRHSPNAQRPAPHAARRQRRTICGSLTRARSAVSVGATFPPSARRHLPGRLGGDAWRPRGRRRGADGCGELSTRVARAC